MHTETMYSSDIHPGSYQVIEKQQQQQQTTNINIYCL